MEEASQAGEGGQKVLLAVDGSKHSIHAFEWYAENLWSKPDHVVLAYCYEFGTHLPASAAATSPATIEALIKKHEDKAHEVFEKFSSIADKNNMKYTLVRLHEPPGASIVKYANENDVGLIVTGSRGHGTLRRTVMGSVSDYIVHHSHVPVIICKHKDEHHNKW